MYSFSEKSLKNMDGINPRLKEVMIESIKRSPIDFGIPADGGKRTAMRQNELFKKKLSNADGYKKIGKHQTGDAVDVFAFVDGQASWDEGHLSMIAGVVLSTAAEMGVQMRWGGTFGSDNFKGWDKPHFELL